MISDEMVSAKPANRLPLVTAILLGVLIVEIGALFAVHVKRDSDRELARAAAQEQRDKAETEQRAEERTRNEATRVPLDKTKYECNATNSETTCYVTNFETSPITTCMQGLLTQKDAAGVRLYSLPMCSGPVKQYETRTVSVPWDGGRAVDMCKSERGFLDFEKCSFKVIEYEPKK